MSSSPRTRLPLGLLLSVGTVVLVAAIVVIAVAVTGKDPVQLGRDLLQPLYPPAAVTAQGEEIRDLYDIVFAIAAMIFFLVEGLIIWTVLRYRRKPGDDQLPSQIHGHFGAEIVWTVVPTIIVAALFVVSWQTLNSIEKISAEPDLKVRAVASQFQWAFDYMPADWDPNDPDESRTPTPPLYSELRAVERENTGGMVLPTGRTVQLYLSSKDVIHAFYVPQFLFKRDVVPGVNNVFEFTINDADAGNTFHGQCAELCGFGHRAMEFDVVAVGGSAFDTWLSQQIEKANATPPPTPSGEPGVTLDVSAKDIAFAEKTLSAPADAPFAIRFDNQDAGVQHNVEIRTEGGQSLFIGEIFTGVDERTYAIPSQAAGTYIFICTVHPIPAMTGTLTVGQ